MYTRRLNLLKSQSFFIFGARETGKTTFLKQQFSHTEPIWIDLLKQDIYSDLLTQPERLLNYIPKQFNNRKKNNSWIVIDEVQKVPQLLDVVHRLIEEKKYKFALTGSSARKLKRNAANLLAGRAFVFKLFPLTHLEAGDDFDLLNALSIGTLPKVFSYKNYREATFFLKAYAETYLKEEILVEQLIRKLPPFYKFLEIAAQQDTEIINLTNIGRDIASDPKIVKSYFEILEETLLGFSLQPFHYSHRKRFKKAPKFYWFDTGVRRALALTIDDKVKPSSFEFGSLFESFIVNEIYRLLVYQERSFKLSYLRLDEKTEIDLIVERHNKPTLLIEIKSTDKVHESHIESLFKVAPNIKNSRALLLSRDPNIKHIKKIECFPWQKGIQVILDE